MRRLRSLTALCAVLALGRSALAQDASYHAIVVQAEAEVRAGASIDPRLYATNRLQRGDHVEVIEDAGNGWLKIRPPSRSYSWIDAKQIERIDKDQANFVVKADVGVAVPVYIGSDLLNGAPPTVESCKVYQGTQIVVVGMERKDDSGAWLPIKPPPAESRYIRAEAVTRSTAPAPPTTTLVGRSTAPSATTMSIPGTTTEALWTRAQQAERTGQDTEAIRLYSMIAQEALQSQPELAAQALERARVLTEAQRNAAAAVPGYPSLDTPLDRSGGRTYGLPAGGPDSPTVRLAPPAASPTQADTWLPPSSGTAQPAAIYASGPGRLRHAGRSLDNRPTYVLEGGPNRIPLYVTAQVGIDLEGFLNRKVELFGPSIYRGDLRANYMSVIRVQPLPE